MALGLDDWKKISVTTYAAVENSILKRMNAVLDSNSVHTKYRHFEHNVDSSLSSAIYTAVPVVQ